jgi:hypothetical protein
MTAVKRFIVDTQFVRTKVATIVRQFLMETGQQL